MAEKIAYLIPEMVFFITICVVMLMGTSKDGDTRRTTVWITGVGLFFALIAAGMTPAIEDSLFPLMARFVKMIVCIVGLLLLFGTGSIDSRMESELESGRRRFDPLDTSRGEYLSFFMLSLMGVMLCSIAGDLIWLFLALELTSLPTYVMIAISRSKQTAHESAVKYFYLGALSAAIFLYGFALLYGATGSMHLAGIRDAFVQQQAMNGHINLLGVLGITIAVIGVSFKIAAFPMHFYTADVYDGASTQMAAFLAFVPKTAGFVVMILLLSTVYGLTDVSGVSHNTAWPNVVQTSLWLVAVLTMTIGNTLALLQQRTKRILAYSSIAHSGYMLIGILAGPMAGGEATLTHNGFAAVLFYLLAYGVTNVGSFFVLGCLQRAEGEELETLDDLRGIAGKHPWLSGILAICAMTLLGIPPMVGFFGKVYLFAAGISAGEIAIVIIAGLNSAVSAWYYLKLAGLPWLGKETSTTGALKATRFTGLRIAAMLSACGVMVLIVAASPIMMASHRATQFRALEHRARVNEDTLLGPGEAAADSTPSEESATEHVSRSEHADG